VALFLAGNINGWQPNDERFRFRPNGDGSFRLDFQADLETLEYKITRGQWSAAEGDARGKEAPNRVAKISTDENELWLRVESWTDLYEQAQGYKVPENVLLLHPHFLMPQLGRSRRIWAYLPPDYWANPARRFDFSFTDGDEALDGVKVNNAGLQRDSAFHNMTLKDWQFVLDVNLTGQFLCAREAIREFLQRGPRRDVSVALGKIICMSSVHEVIPWGGHVNYAASKGGVMLMMKSLAQE
jgi:hypothetical protein